MANKKIARLQESLDIFGKRLGATLVINKSEKGYYITHNDNPIALTSGRTYKELAAYIDGFRDMLLFHINDAKH